MKFGMLSGYWQDFIDSLKNIKIIISLEDVKTIISLVSVLLTATSLGLTRRFWLAANRPIVSASIVSYEPGNVGTVYSLVVYNTGNRPATSIRLYAKKEDLDRIIDPDADNLSLGLVNAIRRCFSSEAIIPLLINGKETSNSFGSTSSQPGKNVLKYNSQLPIRISYSDLDDRNYKSKQVFKVKISQDFAGGQWLKPS